MLGLAPFVLAEITFALLDWGRPERSEDPFVGFRSVRPLFVLDESGTRREIAPGRLAFFCPDGFAAGKGPREYRIFCLGGSTVQGRPFAIETSFTTWLELSLEAANPNRRWEVVNCGGVSYASYRLVPILEEVLDYEPDLILLYTGHNEFLEDRTYGHIKELPEIVARPCDLVLKTRTYALLRAGYRRLRGRPEDVSLSGRPVLETEVEAMLDYRGGVEQYRRDEKWRRDVVEHFRYNLRRMVDLARNAGVPLVLVNPVCNLRDHPPFKVQHRDGLTPKELGQWETLVSQAADRQGSNVYQAIQLLKQAEAIDDRHAGLHYLMAKCYDAMGEMDHAREAYLRAKEEDVCPLRILEPMNRAVLEVAGQTDTPVVDVRKLFEERSKVGIPGRDLLVDHVHPSVLHGHQLVADALADELVRLGVVRPRAEWESSRAESYSQHFGSLSDSYFAIGEERLERVRRWAQGRSRRQRPAPGASKPPPNPKKQPVPQASSHRVPDRPTS
jgi:lysophospholipase L1-like esterase